MSALAYLLAATHALVWFRFRLARTTNSDERRYIRSAASAQLTLFISGTLTFAFAADVPINAFTRLTHIPHIAILLCHWCSLVWDAATVLVVLHWVRPRGLNPHLVWLVSAPFVMAAIGLGVFFVADHHPGGPVNFVVYLGPSWMGTCYLAIFLVSILVARIITLRVVRRELPRARNRMLRLALILIGFESVLFILFVATRTGIQVAVIGGQEAGGIDWIPCAMAGIANLVLIAGYTCPDYPAYQHIYRTASVRWRKYRSLYPLWADLTAKIATEGAPPAPWRDLFSIANLPFRISQRLADIDSLLTSAKHDANVELGNNILVDAAALPTALDDVSAGWVPRDDYLWALARAYSARRRNLGRPCLHDLPAMAGVCE
ncbi:hypothetical protein B8W66_00565 [Mycobacterium decipiens]|uniref:Uncharacterized protein n=1 Tax=Mycobacterium decipiens TaxID=1430326 RepID=A0A1X2LZX5_9MYCO|nr:hypothetical protein B8W66_00565 [Mycobacterium decipiens]